MYRSTRVKDYMLSKPLVVHPETDLFAAIHLILTHRISGVAVVDERRRLVGMLSELDCLDGILAGTYHQAVGGKVRDHMVTRDLETADVDDDILVLARSMLKQHRRRLPVLNGEGIMVGLVTCRALLKALKDFDAPEDPRERA